MPSKDREQSRLGKRVGRYAAVAGAAAEVGIKIAHTKLKPRAAKKTNTSQTEDSTAPESQTRNQALLIRAALGGLKGPLMKIAQLLGTIPDLVPKEYAQAFATLQSDAPSMGASFVTRRMARELGPAWREKFGTFDLNAAFAASLGQVHQATDRNGQALACKLQYPDMASVVEADLQQLSVLLAIFARFDRALDTREVHAEITERLREELDYDREARSMKLFAAMLENVPNVHVPTPQPELSTNRLLTMTWLDGTKFLEAVDHKNQEDRNIIAGHMFRAWYTSFYRYGIIHGDPHFGNYTIRDDLGINLLDFGCIRIFEPTLIQGVMLLYESLAQNKPDLSREAYELWGFKNPSRDLIEILNIWARFLYAPLLQDKVQAIAETNTGSYGRATARKIHEELRKIGGVTVPRAFVFMDRAAVGLGSVFLRLNATLNWYDLFHTLTADFDLAELEKRQKIALRLAEFVD